MLNIYKKLVTALDYHYTKEELVKGIFSLAKSFLIKEKDFHRKYGLPNHVANHSIIKSGASKINILQVCATVFINESIFKAFLGSLPEQTFRVLKVLVWEYSMEIPLLEKELKFPIGTGKKSDLYHWNNNFQVFTEFYFFKGALDPYAKELSIPDEVAQHIQPFYAKPKGYYIEAIPHPNKAELIYESGDESIMEEMMRLTHYYSQDKITKNKSGKILYSTANKTRKALKLREFFDEEYKEGASVRTHLLIQLLATQKKVSPTVSPVELIKDLFNEYKISGEFNAVHAFVLHLKGTGNIFTYNQAKLGETTLSLLKELPVNKWVSIDNIIKYSRLHRMNLALISRYDFNHKLYFNKTSDQDEWYGSYKSYYTQSHFTQVFLHPSIKATFFFFASYGLIDIAYNQPKGEQHKDYYSVFDDLMYVRLNDLGAYIVGKTKEYIPKKIDSGAKVILSDTSMSIYLTKEDVGKAIMLEPFATKVAPRQFLMDYKVFLKDCKTQQNVKDKILVFKKTFGSDLPTIWEQFFNELENKSGCFGPIGEHFTFHLKEDKDLLILLSREERLKKLIIRAEDYHIIVKKKNMALLRNNLKEYGYLI